MSCISKNSKRSIRQALAFGPVFVMDAAALRGFTYSKAYREGRPHTAATKLKISLARKAAHARARK